MSKTKPKIASLADMKAKREIVAEAPSGLHYKIRPLNLEKHALSGGLPARLRSLAMAGSEGVNDLFKADDATLAEQGASVKEYLDVLVAETVVEPDLWLRDAKGVIVRGRFEVERDDDGAAIRDDDGNEKTKLIVDTNGPKLPDPEAMDVMPPVDYKWLTAVAMGEMDEDGVGRRLWGREPLSRWATFREFHGCDTDCDRCHALLDLFSPA